MNKDIFGAVVPGIQDVLRAILFPAGSLISLNLVFFGITIIFYLLSVILYWKLGKNDEPKWKNMFLLISFIFLTGVWVPLLLAAYMAYLLIISILQLVDVIKHSIAVHIVLRVFLLLILIFTIVILIALPVGGVILANSVAWLAFGWNVFIGSILGIIIALIKNPQKLGFFIHDWSPSTQFKRIFKTLFILIPLITTGLYAIVFVPLPHEPAPSAPTSTEMTSLKLMTYNIRTGTSGEKNNSNQWFNRKEVFVEYLNGLNLDLFGVQEAHYFQIQFIDENLDSRKYEWTGQGRDDGVHGGEATAIFYDREKFEYLDGDTFWLSGLPDYPSNTFQGNMNRVCTWARFNVTQGPSKGAQFCVFNTHYDFADAWQVEASNLIIERITEYSVGLPVFLMGDFNLRNYSVAFNILENYQNPRDNRALYDAFRVYKEQTIGYLPYETTSPVDWDVRKDSSDKSRIDFIFISSQIHVLNCQVLKDYHGNYQTYSDHYPVLLNCEF